MNGTIFDGRGRGLVLLISELGIGSRNLRLDRSRCRFDRQGLGFGHVDDISGDGHGQRRSRLRFRHAGEHFLGERRGRFLLAALRHARTLVHVLRVARGAACLLDFVFNHRDHRVVRDAALARTVVVQYVTETQRSLLHRRTHSPEDFRVGWLGKDGLRR